MLISSCLSFLQALLVEKILAATGATPEDIAKCLLMQSALAERGVSPEKIAQALNEIFKDSKMEDLIKLVQNSLASDGISQDDITNGMSLSKLLESGKLRGFKEVMKLFEDGNMDDVQGLVDSLRRALGNGSLSIDALAKTLVLQKALAASDVKPEVLAKVLKLQKALAESGMPKHEIANAMSLALSLGLDGGKKKKDLENALISLMMNGLSPDEVEAVLKLKDSIMNGKEISAEALRLLKKAMKQRRGSVENVAETLMATLAASGENQESIVKAMVKALKATGASPEEIARTMAQALQKGGSSNEEIARVLAAAVADSGATGSNSMN